MRCRAQHAITPQSCQPQPQTLEAEVSKLRAAQTRDTQDVRTAGSSRGVSCSFHRLQPSSQDAVGSPKQRTAGQESPAHEPVHDLNPHGPLTAQPPPSPWDEAPASAGLRGKQPVTAPPSVSNEPAPAVATGMEAFTLLIICYNRPEYLRRTLRGIGAAWPTTGTGPHILLSQDGNDPGVSAVAAQGATLVQEGQAAQASQAPITYQHVQHQQTRAPGDDPSGYSALARHFGWAISEAFKRPEAQYVIIVEDDLEVAVDFFGYFAAVAPVLRADPTLLAASAYNDMGQRSFVGNPARVLRSDFFPGLGWMLTRHVWAELGPKWPSGYWDDWLREPPQRQGELALGRDCHTRTPPHTAAHTPTIAQAGKFCTLKSAARARLGRRACLGRSSFTST